MQLRFLYNDEMQLLYHWKFTIPIEKQLLYLLYTRIPIPLLH